MTSPGISPGESIPRGVATREDLTMLQIIWNLSSRVREFMRTWMPATFCSMPCELGAASNGASPRCCSPLPTSPSRTGSTH